ncbi:ubiquitin hydrolase, putative [Bodo saltans]|uniref:ubiquitinyl hydrolase 1 n=1 Tax=Bodo saltans TaxID=75058 RepID=A0A0S4IZB9_BODSA|nr:ubiquitin hydrolase, putative [Bodo saltans]|eukprot:CUG25198.1 ubiquitin hydrolase, putative [Bodo saltans]
MVREEVGGSAMITGFPNLGNTCYMNSALHALAVVFPLLFQRQQQQEQQVNDASPNRRLTALLRQVFQLRASTSPIATAEPQASSSSSSSSSSLKKRNSDEHHHRKQKLLEPLLLEVKSIAAARNSSFRGHEECDAHEFFRTLLDILHDEHNRGSGRSGTYKEILDQQHHESKAAAASRWYAILRSRDCSPVTDVFYGQQCTNVACTACGNTIQTFDQFSSLHIAVPQEAGYLGGKLTYETKKAQKLAKKLAREDRKAAKNIRASGGGGSHDKKMQKKKYKHNADSYRHHEYDDDDDESDGLTRRNTPAAATANATEFSDEDDDSADDNKHITPNNATLQGLLTNHLREVMSVDGYRCPKCCGPSSAASSNNNNVKAKKLDAAGGSRHHNNNNNEGVTVNVSVSYLLWPQILVVHLKRFNFDGEKILSSFVPPDILRVPTTSTASAATHGDDDGGGEDDAPSVAENGSAKKQNRRKESNVKRRHTTGYDEGMKTALLNDVDEQSEPSSSRFLTYRKVATVEHEGSTLESGHYTATVLSGDAVTSSQATRTAEAAASSRNMARKKRSADSKGIDDDDAASAAASFFVHCDDDKVQAGDGNGANAGFCLYMRTPLVA